MNGPRPRRHCSQGYSDSTPVTWTIRAVTSLGWLSLYGHSLFRSSFHLISRTRGRCMICRAQLISGSDVCLERNGRIYSHICSEAFGSATGGVGCFSSCLRPSAVPSPITISFRAVCDVSCSFDWVLLLTWCFKGMVSSRIGGSLGSKGRLDTMTGG